MEVADDDYDRDVHQGVVEVDRAAQADVGVALAEPEQHSGDEEERREGGGDDHVHLLAGVEAALGGVRAAGEEAAIVAVEKVDLPKRGAYGAAVAEQRDQDHRAGPRHRSVEVDVLDQRPVGEGRRERR